MVGGYFEGDGAGVVDFVVCFELGVAGDDGLWGEVFVSQIDEWRVVVPMPLPKCDHLRYLMFLHCLLFLLFVTMVVCIRCAI